MKRILSLILAVTLMLACAPAILWQANAAQAMVCEHQETGKQYQTLDDALNAVTAGTIVLLADTEANTVFLKPGITLDLGGNTLTADVVVAMNGAIITDGGAQCVGGGLLKIARDYLSFAQGNTNGIIPVWNGVDGYIFTKVGFQQLARTAGTGAAQYIFLPSMSNAEAAALLADGGLDNGLKIQVCLTWNNGSSQQFYTYSEENVMVVFDGTGSKAFDLRITGISGITDMVASPVVVADTRAQATIAGAAVTAG